MAPSGLRPLLSSAGLSYLERQHRCPLPKEAIRVGLVTEQVSPILANGVSLEPIYHYFRPEEGSEGHASMREGQFIKGHRAREEVIV